MQHIILYSSAPKSLPNREMWDKYASRLRTLSQDEQGIQYETLQAESQHSDASAYCTVLPGNTQDSTCTHPIIVIGTGLEEAYQIMSTTASIVVVPMRYFWDEIPIFIGRKSIAEKANLQPIKELSSDIWMVHGGQETSLMSALKNYLQAHCKRTL